MLDDTCIVPTKNGGGSRARHRNGSIRGGACVRTCSKLKQTGKWPHQLGRRRLGDGAWATALERALVDHAWATALGRGRVQLTQEERALVDHGLISRLLDVLGDGPLGTELGLCNAALAILILGQRFEDAGPAGLNCPIGRASLRLSRLRRIVARRALLAMDCPV